MRAWNRAALLPGPRGPRLAPIFGAMNEFERGSAASPARLRSSERPGAPGIDETRPLEVIVVDDDVAMADALRSFIGSRGFACRAAHDGVAAWRLHEARPADIILADWMMPGMTGIELCRQVRAHPSPAGYTYVILMSSFEDQRHFVKGLEAGADDYHRKPVDLEELNARLINGARVVGAYRQLAMKNEELQRDSQRALRLARTDALTNVSNRLAMEEDLRATFSRARRYGHRYSVALCDIDHFKTYNDAFGHLEGDETLRRVARTIQGSLRVGDSLFRYGGDEFVVLLPEQTEHDAAKAMERVREAVQNAEILRPDCRTKLTISVGVASASAVDATAAEWLARADVALYEAKSAGRNRVSVARYHSADDR